MLRRFKKIDYKKELETAAKSMILVHEPDTLIKMIVRMIMQKVKVSHAGILLYHSENDSYVLTVSRGPSGIKIPIGFARLSKENPLIRFFSQKKDQDIFDTPAFNYYKAKKVLQRGRISLELRDLLNSALYQMEIFGAVVCIPSYFRDDLLGLLFLGKKTDNRDFAREELDFFIALASDVAMAIRNAQLFTELESELENKHRLFIHTTIALAAAIDAKDHYTHGHTNRVTNLSLEIAKKMAETGKRAIDAKFLENLHIAGLLHDIGKIGIPESILNKQGPLDADERKVMNDHPLVGAAILQPIRELDEAVLGVKYHHERYDGSGYPEKLKGDQIPLPAAIIAVADTYDAMTTDRPYRKGLNRDEAVKEIKRVSGTQLAPEIVENFLKLYEENRI